MISRSICIDITKQTKIIIIKKRSNEMIKNNISQLLETEMERKDFLKLVGFGVVAATGVTQILKAMTQQAAPRKVTSNAQGYGGSLYGGMAKK